MYFDQEDLKKSLALKILIGFGHLLAKSVGLMPWIIGHPQVPTHL